MKKLRNKELLDKCKRGNKIAPLWRDAGRMGAILLSLKHLSSNFIISTLLYCLTKYRAIFDTSSTDQSEAEGVRQKLLYSSATM